MKKVFQRISFMVSAAGLLAVGLQSCKSDPNSPGFEYMPDMYRSPAIEAYMANDFYQNGMATRQPVENTIPRGMDVYPYPNTSEGYKNAGDSLKNPIPYSKEVVKEGKVYYEKYCMHCHGKSGAGDGKVTESDNWPGGPQAYNGALKDRTAGIIFHVMHYGKGIMGSHASQLTKDERWKITYYVEKLQGKDLEALYGEKKAEVMEEQTEVNNEAQASK